MSNLDAAIPSPAPTPKGKRVNRLGYIDTIRGLAALVVIYFHMARYFVENGLSTVGIEHAAFIAGAYMIDFGKAGVALFFIVSGFVVPFSLLRGKRYPVRDFCISRFFRLYPAYWLSIPFGIYFFFVVPGAPFGLVQLLANLTMLQQFVGQPNAIGVYWTLQIELVFYALCVALYRLGKLRDVRFLFVTAVTMMAIGLGAAVLRGLTGKGLPIALLLALTLMLFGMLWRFWLVEGDEASRRHAKWLAVLFIIAVPVISYLGYGVEGAWYRYTASYYVALAVFLLMTTRWRVSGAVFQYLGRVSYSVYLFAPVVQDVVVRALPPAAHRAISPHLYVVAIMLASVAVASICYVLIEKPAIALGKRLSARLDHGERFRSPSSEVI
ncbi:acyltransferase [Sphingomonas yunnanensis]|uniref:acyltransferase family protein n=1 Tax=Sphingomonas yunnanensis TaxID=310400 RepID=UPI001CA65DC6|nr:acyltransferase [Sphingomonas yunnanensis]MBY9064147.1 acyltransferase [Sphingomonas yunnanensis]